MNRFSHLGACFGKLIAEGPKILVPGFRKRSDEAGNSPKAHGQVRGKRKLCFEHLILTGNPQFLPNQLFYSTERGFVAVPKRASHALKP
jgi:hypothetical protein